MKKHAFTLAEVLITLAIIGVIAAITIPALMTSTRGKEFEVGANKAFSTLVNSIMMRYAMDGISLADYPNTVGSNRLIDYLTKPPGGRQGEQAALQATKLGSSGMYKLKDGMMIVATRDYVGQTPGPGDVIYILIDTNGEKGPTRNSTLSSILATDDPGTFENPFQNWSGKINGQFFELLESVVNPIDNAHPDVITLAIDGTTGAVKAGGTRTRNILSTGNAMISK